MFKNGMRRKDHIVLNTVCRSYMCITIRDVQQTIMCLPEHAGDSFTDRHSVLAHWSFALSPDTHSLLKPLLYGDMHVRACLVTKSSATLCNPWGHSPSDSSVHGIFQARILEWVAIFFSRGYSRPRGLNLRLLLWRVDSSPLSRLGSPLKGVCSSKLDILQARCPWHLLPTPL